MSEWFFARQNPASVRQNPCEQLLFKNDQSSDDEYAGNDQLVREIIQNSLDAKKKFPVRVRLALFSQNSTPSNSRQSSYFSGLKDAVVSKNQSILFSNGVPILEEGFLVCEDFNTCGLEGDPYLTEDPPLGKREDFFWFWRNIGRSGKTGADLGRWGLGKTVYRAASQIGAMLGLTVRDSDHKALAMGQAVLAIHKKDGQDREASGFWGETTGEGAEKYVVPITDPVEIERFCKDWRLKRGNSPGLSVVVPYAAKEINANQLAQAVVVNFFVRILRGELNVEIETPGSFSFELTKESIITEVERIKWDGSRKSKRDQAPPLDFVCHCLEWQGSVFESKTLGEKYVPDFNKEPPFDTDDLLRLRLLYQNGDLTVVNFNLCVGCRRSNPDKQLFGKMRVFLQKVDDKATCGGYYVRSGMTITKISPQVTKRGVRALVLVEDGSLADFLGDTESASHEDWTTTERERLEQNWNKKGAIGFIKFCRSVVDELAKLLTPPVSEANYDLLSEYFSESTVSNHREESKSATRSKRLAENNDDQPLEVIESTPKWFAIRQQVGGFQVVRNINEPLPTKPRLRIQMAYDVSQGDPLKKWSPFDFNLLDDNFKKGWLGNGVKIMIVSGNEITVSDIQENFKLKNITFDQERDLFVRVEDVSGEKGNNEEKKYDD